MCDKCDDWSDVPKIRQDTFRAIHMFRELASAAPGRNNQVVDWVTYPDRGIAALEEGIERIRSAVERGETPGAEVAWLTEATVAWGEENMRSVYAEDEAGFDQSDMPMCPNLAPAAPEEMSEIADRNFQTETCPGCRLCRGWLV